MFKKTFLTGAVVLIIVSFITMSWAAELSPIKLPPPNLKGGKSLMQSLQARKSSRDFSAKNCRMEFFPICSGLPLELTGRNQGKEPLLPL